MVKIYNISFYESKICSITTMSTVNGLYAWWNSDAIFT